MRWKIVILALALQLFSVASLKAETVYLSVAASMTDAFKEIISTFSAAHPEAGLMPNFASSGSLAKQIDQGAPADIYVSANPGWMTYLAEKGLIAPESDRIFAYNQLVFAGVENLKDPTLGGLVGLDRIALGSPRSVPAGQYARQAMENADVYVVLEAGKKLVMAKDVRQALLYADRGEVDGAFVYWTDALLARHARILFTVPAELYDRVSYPLALTVSGAKKDSARAFYDFMAGPEAEAILREYGFEPNR